MTTSSICPLLVGRASELDMLRRARGAGGGVVIVAGEAGIGKSRLLREFAEGVTDRSSRVVWGRPETVSEPGPYSLVIDLLEDLIATHGPVSSEASELLAALTQSQPGRDPPPARQIAARTRGLIADLGDGPVVLLEDLNAADEPSQAVVAHLARSARDDGTLIVGALRSEEELTPGTARLLDVLHRDRLSVRIDLLPLERSDIREMLVAMWGEEPSEGQLEAIWSQGEGVPFFTEELGAARGQSNSVPQGIATGITSRLQRLSPQAKRLVEAAALSPGAIDPRILARAVEVPEETVPRSLVEGIAAGLLADREGRIVYRHGLLREAVARSLVSVQRQALHRAIALSIEETISGDVDRYALALAHHYGESGDHDVAGQWLAVAGLRALASGAVDDAEGLLKEALELGPDAAVRARILRGLAEVSTRLNDHESAIDLLSRAAKEWKNTENTAAAAEALAEEAWLLATAGEPRAAEVIKAAFDALNENDGKARVRFREAQVHALVVNQAAAAGMMSGALSAAEAESDAELVALCSLELARIYTSNGLLEKAQLLGRKARSVVLENGLNHLVGQAFASEASMDSRLGQNQAALTKLDEARSRLIEGLSSHHIVGVDATRAGVLWHMGQPDDADRISRRMEVGQLTRGYGRVIRVWAAMERGDEAWARSFVERWWDHVGQRYRDLPSEELRSLPESPEGGQYAQLADAVLAGFSDRPTDQDEDRARRYWELCARAVRDVWLQSAWLLLRCLVTRGLVPAARQTLSGSDFRTDHMPPYHRAFLLEVEGNIELRAGQGDQAGGTLHRAQQLFETIGNASDRARVLIALATLSDKDAAKEHLRMALLLASESGALKYARQAEAALRSMGVRPRAGRPKGSARKEGLSAREEEVVTLVATGATNAEIAARLFLSERTVQDHLKRAGQRLGLSGRAGLAAWAAKQGLI